MNEIPPKRIAITGGTGFIGGCFARFLREMGHYSVVPLLLRKIGLSDAGTIAEAIGGRDVVARFVAVLFGREQSAKGN